MAAQRIVRTVISETAVRFTNSPVSGHDHDGVGSALIDTTKYSIFDFSPTPTQTYDNQRKIAQERNSNVLKSFIVNAVKSSVEDGELTTVIQQVGGSTTLAALTDVDVSSASNGDFLKYNGSSWVGEAVGSGTTLATLSDVDVSTASDGDFLKYNGSSWVDTAIALGTNTSGAFVSNVAGGTGITVTYPGGQDGDTEGSNPTVAVDTSSVPLKTDDLSVFASTTSAQLRTLISDETGTGALVFASAPSMSNIAINDGTAGAPAIDFASDTNTGIFRSTTDTLAIAAGGNTSCQFGATAIFPLTPSTGSTSGANDVYRNATFGFYVYITSSEQYKSNIATFENSGEIIDQLRPVTFTEKVNENDTEESAAWKNADIQYGFIAEEVAQIADGHLGSYLTDGDNLVPNGWKNRDFIAVLVAEVKSLRQRVLDLESRLQ